jgi:magnesium chelatase family protein
MLVAALNPCPCGFFSHPEKPCRCSLTQVEKYRNKISGPLLDRIDIHIDVPPVAFKDLRNAAAEESSASIRNRVINARNHQARRFAREQILTNAQMKNRHLKKFCPIDSGSARLLETAVDKLHLSARAYNRVLKIARTIADLEGDKNITQDHIAEAVQYRSLDRNV